MEHRRAAYAIRCPVGRRDILFFVGSAILSASLEARADGTRPRIGVLSLTSAEGAATDLSGLREGLQSLGYVAGKTVDIDYRYADGDTTRLTALAQELIQLKPGVILADTPSAAKAVKSAAPSLPVVCPAISQTLIPILAASYAHPGGSVTGVAVNVEGITGKLAELALQLIPNITKIGFLSNPAGNSMAFYEEQVRAVAKAHGIEVVTVQVRTPDDLVPAFQRFNGEKVQAVILTGNALLNSQRKLIAELALASHLPTLYNERQGVDVGGLASYGVDSTEAFRSAAAYIDKILKGAAPGDLPIEFPTKIDLVINLRTAKALGLAIPPMLLARATEVVE